MVEQADPADLVLAAGSRWSGLRCAPRCPVPRRSCAGSRRRPGRSARSSGAGRRARRRPAARRPAARGRPPARAARRRSRPPGGGRRAGRSRSSPRVSSMVRKANTPGSSSPSSVRSPSMGGMNDRLPVAMISTSYGVTWPSSPKTTLANRSIRVTRTPACRVMSFSTYQRQAVEEDVRVGLLARTARGEHDPVVVAVRLVAEHGDGELFRAAAGEDLLDGAGAGHAVADDDQVRRVSARPAISSSSSVDAVVDRTRHQTSTRPTSTTTDAGQALGRRDVQLDDGAALEVLDDPQRHVHVGLGADREVAHRHAVAHQHQRRPARRRCCRRGSTAPGRPTVRHDVAQRGVQRRRLVDARPR